mmetsp:Transcript_92342/g.166794  ORF Transcript_92342/g.166794 Transcript_92342/m.166794 type:complete len:320 (-) Transcript_92342:565-1524(-)
MPGTTFQHGSQRQSFCRQLQLRAQLLGEEVHQHHSQSAPLDNELRADVHLLREPGGVLQADDAGVHQQPAIPVLWQGSQSLRSRHLEAHGQVQRLDHGVHEPLRQLVEGHQVGAGLAVDVQRLEGPDVTPQDAVRLQRPDAVEALRAHAPQVLQTHLAVLGVGHEVVHQVTRPGDLGAEELRVLLQGIAQPAQELGAAGHSDERVVARDLEVACQDLLCDVLQGSRVHACPEGRIHGEQAVLERIHRGLAEALAGLGDLPTWGDVLPSGSRPGVEEHGHEDEVHQATGLLHLVAIPVLEHVLEAPAVEVAEAGVGRHLE